MWCDRKHWMTNLQLLNRTKSTWLQPWSRRRQSWSSHWMEALLVILTILLQQYSRHKNDLQVLILSWMMLCMSLVLQHLNAHRSMYVSLTLYIQAIVNWDAVNAWGLTVCCSISETGCQSVFVCCCVCIIYMLFAYCFVCCVLQLLKSTRK